MITFELLIIFLVAIVAFGPSKLPMLASHLSLLIKKTHQFKSLIASYWEQQIREFELLENQKKAEDAEKKYQKIDKRIDSN